MAVKNYNQGISVAKSTDSFTIKYLEYGLLYFIAATGLLCSGFALIDNSHVPSHNFDKKAALVEPISTVSFDKIVKIRGAYTANTTLEFEIILELIPSKYVLDMGDNRRVILTQNNFDYKFEKKGTYLLELKEISRGLITVVASKKITIE
jgi:hypothetical protein